MSLLVMGIDAVGYSGYGAAVEGLWSRVDTALTGCYSMVHMCKRVNCF